MHIGQEITTTNQLLINNTTLKAWQNYATCKCLGISESTQTHKDTIMTNIAKEYHRRVSKIVLSLINKKVMTISASAMLVLRYTGRLLNCTIKETIVLDIAAERILTMNRLLNPKVDKDCLHTLKINKRRGLITALTLSSLKHKKKMC